MSTEREYLGKDLTDLPVTGKMKDENDRDVIVRTGFADLSTKGEILLVEGQSGIKYRVFQYTVMSNNDIQYYFIDSNNTKLCATKLFSFVADCPQGGYLFEGGVGKDLKIQIDSDDNDVIVSIDMIFGEVKG